MSLAQTVAEEAKCPTDLGSGAEQLKGLEHENHTCVYAGAFAALIVVRLIVFERGRVSVVVAPRILVRFREGVLVVAFLSNGRTVEVLAEQIPSKATVN